MATWARSSRIRTAPSSSIPKAKKFFNIKGSDVGPGSYNPEKKSVLNPNT
jgi:hypothetical protein